VPLAALATVLVAVGYKLSSRKIIVGMWRQGLTQFIPFAVTVVGIVFTDLLKGIAIGVLTGVFFVIRSNYTQPITLVERRQPLADALQQGHVLHPQGRAEAPAAPDPGRTRS
jgi:MFS superfamily sulfate permease-like transporter